MRAVDVDAELAVRQFLQHDARPVVGRLGRLALFRGAVDGLDAVAPLGPGGEVAHDPGEPQPVVRAGPDGSAWQATGAPPSSVMR